MTILTKQVSGAKLNPKSIDAANVESGAVIEQVYILKVFLFLSLSFTLFYVLMYRIALHFASWFSIDMHIKRSISAHFFFVIFLNFEKIDIHFVSAFLCQFCIFFLIGIVILLVTAYQNIFPWVAK